MVEAILNKKNKIKKGFLPGGKKANSSENLLHVLS